MRILSANLIAPEWRWFFRHSRPVIRSHTLAMFLLGLSTAGFVIDPLIIKWLIDSVLPRHNGNFLLLAVVAVGGIACAQVVSAALGSLVSVRAVQTLVRSLRLAIFDHLTLLSADFHERVAMGERLYIIQQDVNDVAEMGSALVPAVVQTTALGSMVLIAMFILNHQLTYMLIPLVPAFLILKRAYTRRLERSAETVRKQVGFQSSFINNHLLMMLQIQLLGVQEAQRSAFECHTDSEKNAVVKRNREEIMFRVASMSLIIIGQVLLIGFGGRAVFLGTLSIGGFVAFYSYFIRLFSPLGATVDICARASQLTASLRRIAALMEEKPSICNGPAVLKHPPGVKEGLEIDNVFFGYQGAPPVLAGMSMQIRPQEKLVLAGHSGCGKSTLMKLIVRLYDVDQGEIRIGGINIRDFPLAGLRRAVRFVTQEPVLFDMSIKDNLRIGTPDASDVELRYALEVVGLEQLIRTFRCGWDTILGPDGVSLSVGEKQRLAIARAIVRPPAVLLLDEATSGLDVIAEHQVFLNLTRHLVTTTVVFASHHIAAMRWADRVAVLHHGRLEEMGYHAELVRANGIYASFYKIAACPYKPVRSGRYSETWQDGPTASLTVEQGAHS